MALGSEPDTDLKVAFHDLRELKVDVAYPFLLELYRDYKADLLSRADLLASVRLVEAYVFRRAICAIPTNSMNKTFATFTKTLKKDRYFESIQAHFLGMPSYRRFPTDDEFRRDLQTRDLYNFRTRSYWLRRLENYGRKERVLVDEYPPDFFDLIIIDECHRGGANDESTWRDILTYFKPAVQLGLTATPKRKSNSDTYKYFGEPVYIYSLREGINDGFLTPFKVKQIATTMDDYPSETP